MDIEKLIKKLQSAAKLEAYYNSEYNGLYNQAATALSSHQAENESLKEKLYDGEDVNLVDYWMQQAKIEENGHRNCQAENEKLRAELDDLKAKWDKYQPREHWETLNELCENLHDELEQVKRERDAAIEDLHGKCSACANYTPYHNDGPCATCKFEIACFVPEKATGKWQWRGPVKED